MTRSKHKYDLVARCLAQHWKTMLDVARPHAGGAIEAEDIVQEAVMKTLAHCDRLNNEAAVVAWLRRVIEREGLRASARRGRRDKLRTRHMRHIPESVDPAPRSSGFEERVAEAVRAAESLPPDQRRVVHCVLEGLSHGETAATLDKTEGAVRVLWHRAVRKLRRILRD